MLTASARARGTLLKRGKWRHGIEVVVSQLYTSIRAAASSTRRSHGLRCSREGYITPRKYTFSTLLVEFNYEFLKFDFSCPLPSAMLHNFHYVCNAELSIEL